MFSTGDSTEQVSSNQIDTHYLRRVRGRWLGMRSSEVRIRQGATYEFKFQSDWDESDPPQWNGTIVFAGIKITAMREQARHHQPNAGQIIV